MRISVTIDSSNKCVRGCLACQETSYYIEMTDGATTAVSNLTDSAFTALKSSLGFLLVADKVESLSSGDRWPAGVLASAVAFHAACHWTCVYVKSFYRTRWIWYINAKMSSAVYVLSTVTGYVLTSAFLLKCPTLLRRRKRETFRSRHISHRGGEWTADAFQVFNVSVRRN